MTLTPNLRRHLLGGAALALSLALASPVLAQTWPAKPVRIVVPFVAGGTTDVVARVLGQKLTEMWGQTVKDFVAAAKAKPGIFSFGSSGVGGQVHLAAENFADAAGIDMQHVPYKGEAPAYTDLVSGQTQVMVGNIAAAAALLGPDRLRALAVTGKQRSPLLPDVPTAAEAGLPGLEYTGWFGLLAPAGTPPEVVAKVHRDSVGALGDSQIKARLYVLGMAPVGSSPAEFGRQMDAELKRWAQVVKNRKLTAN